VQEKGSGAFSFDEKAPDPFSVPHATSGAHYLRECLPYPEFWDLMPLDQHAQSTCDKILEFCGTH